jgi:hypothetical protein
MQIAGSFFDQNFYGRKTNGSGTTGWNLFWHAGNDGSGSGLDADLLDGQNSSYFATASSLSSYLPLSGGTLTGVLNANSGIYSPKIGISSSNLSDSINGAPWYGLGATDLTFGATQVPQFAGYYGLRIRTASTIMDFAPNGDSGNINVSGGGFKIAGSVAWHAGNDGSGSGLDADTVDGISSGSFARNDVYNSVNAGFQVFRNIGTNTGSWPDADHTLSLENSDAGNIVLNFHRGGYTSNNIRYTGSVFHFDLGLQVSGSTVWHAGNDGSGSGLDADLLDGVNLQSIVYDKGVGQVGVSSNWNDYVAPGMYGVASGSAFSGSNNPGSVYTYGHLLVTEANGQGLQQTYYPHIGDKILLRTGWNDGNWYSWQQIWTSTSDGSGSGLDADTLDGVDSSGFWTKSGSWYGSGLPGSRLQGISASGGEFVLGDGLPNAGQIGVLIDGAYVAGENNGFWSLASDNTWGSRRGMYWDGSYLNFTTNSAVSLFSSVASNRYVDSSNTFVFRVGSSSGVTRHINLSDSDTDPSAASINSGITWGARTDTNPYYLIYCKPQYNNGYSTHTRLTLAWHTGIEIGAASGYGGTRFFNNSPFTGSDIFSVGKGDNNVRVENTLYVGGNVAWHAGNDGSGSGLDADTVDGINPSTSLSASTIAVRDSSGALYSYYGKTNTSSDWNSAFTTTPVNCYQFHGDISSGGPTGTWWFYESMRHSNSGNYWGTQIAWGWEDNANQLYQRNVTGNSWSGWVKYWNSGNDGSGSGLDADTLDGVDSSGFARARTRSNWNDSTVINNVVGQLAWKNYGNSHTIFDASNSTSPDGTSVNNTNAAVAWSGSYPTLMGWNGSSTYGVRVDSARVADNVSGFSGTYWTSNNDGSGSGLDADTVDGYSVGNSTNQIPYLNSSRNLSISNPEAYSGEVRLGAAWNRGGIYAASTLSLSTSGSEIHFIFGDVRKAYVTNSGNVFIDGSVNAATYNKPGLLINSSGTSSSGAAFGMQQVTTEGWTGIFVDFEPYTGWGLYHDNPNNYFCVTAESSTGNLRSFTVPSRESGNRTAYEKIRFNQGDGSITAGGNITALSDIRVKENIELISNAIDKITKIRGVTYTKNNDETGRKYAGVIAQEVEKVLPEVVFNTDESDPDSAKTVAYGNMIGLLIEAIKEQQKQIDELKAALSNK